MTRRLRTFLLILGLLWQPLAALLPAGLDERAEQITHAVVHGQALGHHHHDDASLHLEADAGVTHQHALDGGQPPGLPVWLASVSMVKPPTAFAAASTPMPPSALLEGPLRPPRAHVV